MCHLVIIMPCVAYRGRDTFVWCLLRNRPYEDTHSMWNIGQKRPNVRQSHVLHQSPSYFHEIRRKKPLNSVLIKSKFKNTTKTENILQKFENTTKTENILQKFENFAKFWKFCTNLIIFFFIFKNLNYKIFQTLITTEFGVFFHRFFCGFFL